MAKTQPLTATLTDAHVTALKKSGDAVVDVVGDVDSDIGANEGVGVDIVIGIVVVVDGDCF